MEIAFREYASDGGHADQCTTETLRAEKDRGDRAVTVIRRPIGPEGLELRRTQSGALVAVAPAEGSGEELVALMLPHVHNESRTALLMLAGSCNTLLVDGHPALPLVVLHEGAEISVGGELVLYRESSPSEIRSFDGEPGQECVRCKRALASGDAVRLCSHCDSPHHEGLRGEDVRPRELRCASYDPRCGRCGSEWIAMSWSPEEIFDD